MIVQWHRYQPDPINDHSAPRTEIFHLDGLSWFDAPVPRRWHRCLPQTHGIMNYFTTVQRCPCGAIREGEGYSWLWRNSRRKERS